MIKLVRARNGEIRVKIIGDNNELLLSSETVKSKQSCMKNIEAAKKALNEMHVVDETKRKTRKTTKS